MRVSIELRGTTPLLCHNVRLADPDDEFARRIGEITSKRKKTEEDRKAIARLEWFGGLYAENGSGPMMPTGNIRKCLIQAAKINKLGTHTARALAFRDLTVPIAYEGPRDLEKLWQQEEFRHKALVGVRGNRTPRTRPCFPQWAIVGEAELLENVLNPDDLKMIVNLAGLSEGLGDNRINGYGRFEGKVVTA